MKFPKETYKQLEAFARVMGMPPDVVVVNLVTAHLEMKPTPIPTPEKAEMN